MFLTSFINPKNTVSFLILFFGGGFYPGGSQSRSRFARRLGIRVGVPERSAAPVSPETRKVKKSSKNHRQAGAGLLLLVLPDEKTGKREERGKKTPSLHFPGDFLVQSQHSVRRGAADGPGLQG
ncbi:hypothetical protein AMECASPLE_003661 [Ameca splendens]|uniref:Uncharacterized protein n=1 Tax=Ameca splendens TaxID=208324 RepID=A0ABV1A4W6_9TELE